MTVGTLGVATKRDVAWRKQTEKLYAHSSWEGSFPVPVCIAKELGMIERKAVLVSVGNDYSRYAVHMPIAPPLGILALGSFLEHHGVPVELIDVQVDFGFGTTAEVERRICRRVAQYLKRQTASIAWVGISMLSNTGSGLVLGEAIRAALPDTPIVYGGYFPTRVSKLLLQDYPFITAIVRGDGEAAALQISRLLADGRPFPCGQVPNLAWREHGRIRTTTAEPIDVDVLPIVNYRLLHNRRCYPVVLTMLSRGCPFHCTYCSESTMRPYAAYSIDWVRQQFDHLEKEVTCSRIGILDPVFGVGRKRTLEIIKVMRGRRFSYGLESRVDVLTPDLIPLLHEAGVALIFWGIESGSVRTLKRMKKVPSEAGAKRYLDDARAVLRACMENNVVPLVGLMFGFPGETETDCRATLRLAMEINQIQTEVTNRTGVESGFVPFATPTIVYDGTPLAKLLPVKYPRVRLQPAPFVGESNILSPSSRLRLSDSKRYAKTSDVFASFTPNALEQLDRFSTFVPKKFTAAHPELTDRRGVTVISPDVRRLG